MTYSVFLKNYLNSLTKSWSCTIHYKFISPSVKISCCSQSAVSICVAWAFSFYDKCLFSCYLVHNWLKFLIHLFITGFLKSIKILMYQGIFNLRRWRLLRKFDYHAKYVIDLAAYLMTRRELRYGQWMIGIPWIWSKRWPVIIALIDI